jgi:ABC-type branched-subunit amino acid transport system substrate-binding protein
MYWIQGIGMWEAAQLAAQKINDAGGINGHRVDLYQASDHPNSGTDPDVTMGTQAMTQLMSYGVDFVQGGFRTEAVIGERTVAMNNQKIFTLTGASTDELIDHPDIVTYPETVRANYNRYKYMFRTTPVNSTTLFYSIASFLAYTMVAKLMPIYTLYAKPFKIAVVSENLAWTAVMHYYLTMPYFWNTILGLGKYGGGVNVVYANKVDPVGTDWVPGVLTAIEDSGARLIIEVISGPSGRAFVAQWGNVEANAALAGIDVPGQEVALHWTATTGKCETESFLVTAGGADDPNSGNPINTVGPVKTADFYHEYYNAFGHAPIYTSYGSFDTLMGLKETIEAWITRVGHDWPPVNQAEYDLLIPIMEMTNRASLTGQFKYTGPNPLPGQTYPPAFGAINPTKMGTLHDIYSFDRGATWPGGYTRALVASWQVGRLEIVFPVDRPYSKIWALPSWMYPYPTDVNQDGKHNIQDIAIVSFAIDTTPTNARWQFVADYTKNLVIDGDDLAAIAFDYGPPVPLPLP